MTILYYLIFMMDMDGIITPEEETLIREFGHLLGFRIDLVTDLIHVIKNHPAGGNPTDELMDTIRTYLN